MREDRLGDDRDQCRINDTREESEQAEEHNAGTKMSKHDVGLSNAVVGRDFGLGLVV